MGVRLFAASFAMLLHGAVALALLNPGWFERPPRAPQQPRKEATVERTAPRPASFADRRSGAAMRRQHSRSQPAALPAIDPTLPRAQVDAQTQASYDAGWAYEAKRMAAIQALNAQRYSPEVALLLRRPIQEAWPQLEVLAQSGNRDAGDALHDLAFECRADPTLAAGAFGRMGTALLHGIPDADRAFVTGALAHEYAVFEDIQRQCRSHGLGWARLAAMLGLPDPATDPHGGEYGHREALAEAFRATFGGTGDLPMFTTPGAGALHRLMDDQSPAAADDLAIAIEAAGDEPYVAGLLAYCFEHGCGRIPALPPQELRPWQERAAGSGSAGAADALIAADESGGELLRAFAWAWFSRWVASNACDATPRALDYAAAAKHLARIGARLHPSARMRAEREGAALIARLGPAALAATGCSD